MKLGKFRRILSRGTLLILGNVVVLVLLLVVVEGSASWLVLLREFARTSDVAERLHTRHDAELGWVSLPNVRRPEMYGRGKQLTTNSRGFRGQTEFAQAVPAGKIRAICSGDSFTLGYGVSDDETWCQLLTKHDPRLETVNMGQGGYGVDQAYLWFRRDARDLQHQIHIFAFITDDFHRMTRPYFLGYPKPLLTVRNGRIEIANAPVPAHSYAGWFTRHSSAIRSLRFVTISESALGRLRPKRPAHSGNTTTLEKTRTVLPLLFADLKRRNDEQKSRLVLVYLPTTYDLNAQAPRRWAAFLQEQANALHITFIDLFEDFRKLPRNELDSLFLQKHDIQFEAASGHLNRAGNELVASLIYQKLASEGFFE
jgi:lysophospholipase L1-like esterase